MMTLKRIPFADKTTTKAPTIPAEWTNTCSSSGFSAWKVIMKRSPRLVRYGVESVVVRRRQDLMQVSKKTYSPIVSQKEVFILLAGNEIFVWSGADSVPVQRAVGCMKAVELAKFEMTAHIHHISGSDDGKLPMKLAEVLLCGQSSPNKSESFYSFSSALSTTGQSLWLMPRRETVSDTDKRRKVWKIGRGPNGGMTRELCSVLSVSDPRCSYLIDKMVIPGEFKQECSWGVGLLHGNLTSSLVRTYARMCYDELVRSRGGSSVCLTHEGTIGVESATAIQEWFLAALGA